MCLGENPTRIDNNRPLAAPLPCADAVFNVSGVEGTSYVLTDLTPGRFYSFRVVTRDDSGGGKGGDEGAAAGGKVGKDDSAAAAAVDKGSVSALAVSVASGAVAEGGDVSYSNSSGGSDGASRGDGEDFAAMAVDVAPELAFCGARRSVFPNGTLLLDGASIQVSTPAACCLACSRAMGCNAWAHCDPESSPECEALGVSRQCWLMYVPLSELTKSDGKSTSSNADASSSSSASPPFPAWRAGEDVPWWQVASCPIRIHSTVVFEPTSFTHSISYHPINSYFHVSMLIKSKINRNIER